MCSQMVMLLLIALSYAAKKGTMSDEDRDAAVAGIRAMPKVLDEALHGMRDTAQRLARLYSEAKSFLYLGRGPYYPLSMEGALKLKESYNFV